MKQFKLKMWPFVAVVVAGMAITIAGAAPSTEAVISKANGLHIGNTATDRVGMYNATPVAQQASTITPFVALQNLGPIAAGQDYTDQHVQVALTAAQINGMAAAPVQLVAAQGGTKSVVVDRVMFTITRTATAFASGGAVIVQYSNAATGAGTQSLDSTIASTVITGAAGTTVTLRNGAVISDLAAASIQNIGVFISNQTGAFTTGTGTATVDVWYRVF